MQSMIIVKKAIGDELSHDPLIETSNNDDDE